MRILMVLWDDKGFPPDPRVEKECRSLVAAGHRVTLLCRKRPWQRPSEVIDGVTVRRVDINLDGVHNLLHRGGTRLGVLRHHQWEDHMRHVIKECRPDVVHSHDLRPLGSVLSVCCEAPFPMVVADLHEIYPEAIKYYLSGVFGWAFCTVGRWEHQERTGMRKSDAAVTISRQASRYYKRKYDFVPNVIRNTVDYHEFDRLVGHADEDAPSTPRIIYAGGYNAKRGINILVSAMDIIAQETDAHLCLVGPMPKGQLAKLVKPSTLERIQFTGTVAAHRLPALMKTATVAVHPLLVDSPQTNFCCPHKIFEYMAAGKPIVASRAESFEEYIEANNAGILVKPDRVDKLAEGVIHLVQHKDRAEEMGNNGRKAVEAGYNWDYDGERLCKLYESM